MIFRIITGFRSWRRGLRQGDSLRFFHNGSKLFEDLLQCWSSDWFAEEVIHTLEVACVSKGVTYTRESMSASQNHSNL